MNQYLKELKKDQDRKDRPYLFMGIILAVTYFSLMYYLLVQFSEVK
jgi:hypothetical protein